MHNLIKPKKVAMNPIIEIIHSLSQLLRIIHLRTSLHLNIEYISETIYIHYRVGRSVFKRFKEVNLPLLGS